MTPVQTGRGAKRPKTPSSEQLPKRPKHTARKLEKMTSRELLDAMALVGMAAVPITPTSRPLIHGRFSPGPYTHSYTNFYCLNKNLTQILLLKAQSGPSSRAWGGTFSHAHPTTCMGALARGV